MANLSKIKRDQMIEFLEELKEQHNDDASIRAFNMIENHLREKKYGLVWEEHSEEVDDMLAENIPVLVVDEERRICKDPSKPWNFLIEGDNLQALYLLQKTHKGKVDCIYIDPPYNTGARDWKYNNDYVDGNDVYRHSKWLSMMNRRLLFARELLKQEDSVLMLTIDDNELSTIKLLLEELFPVSQMQIVDMYINPKGKARVGRLSQVDEYLIVVYLGNAKTIAQSTEVEYEEIRWPYLRRSDIESARGTTKGGVKQFYPIYVDDKTSKIVAIGEPLTPEEPLSSAKRIDGATAVFPIKKDGTHMNWGLTGESLLYALENGCVKVTQSDNPNQPYNFQYVTMPSIKKMLDGTYVVLGINDDGTKIVANPVGKESQLPTVWKKTAYDANAYGTKLIGKFLVDKRFSFPKSLYSVYDSLKVYLENKPNAIVVDFFAGSGTTGHAVNLLNSVDDGNRTCIMVTNNEISEAEERKFAEDNYGNEGLVAWDKMPNQKNSQYKINYDSKEFVEYKDLFGISKYVTWPRTYCTILGENINGIPVDGYYSANAEEYEKVLEEDHKKCYKKKKVASHPELKSIKISDGFISNYKYLKCEWTPRKPEEYLLSNALCLHVKEMIELQNHIELDNVKNCLLLNKSDFDRIVNNPEVYAQIENIWINQNMILDAEEMKLLDAKGFKYIPREFFGQELREVGE